MREKRLILWDEEENTVSQLTITQTNTTTIPRAIRKLNHSQIDTPILPYGTVLMKKDGNTSIYFIQVPPEKLVVQFKPKTEGAPKTTNYKIAYPWRIFGLMFKGSVISDYFLRFAKGPIRRLEDQLYRPPLPNMNEDGSLCVGFGMVGYTGKTGPMATIAEKVISWVDRSRYNNDLATGVNLVPQEMNPPENICTNIDARVSFDLWQKWTKEADRKWRDITSLSWTPIETFEAFVERIK